MRGREELIGGHRYLVFEFDQVDNTRVQIANLDLTRVEIIPRIVCWLDKIGLLDELLLRDDPTRRARVVDEHSVEVVGIFGGRGESESVV